MGVRGLTTYINCNEEYFLQRHLLHDTQIVIDGHSLCAQLYRLINCFSAFGGDYDKYASYARKFFKNLKKCNITPFVLFDGSYETKKLKTAYSRLRSKIYGASKLDPVTQDSLQIFPLLLRDVFKEVLIEMKIPYTVCEFEADDEIASMARYLQCPVLSYDSDFFIYNVLYIPFNKFELKPKPVHINGTKIFVIECKIYKVEFLCKYFGGLKEDMLPLLATLLGNDYIEKKVFNKFFSQLKIQKSKSSKNEQQRCINGLFKWLQNETLDSAINKIIGRLKKGQKDKVVAIMRRSINGYSRTYCRSLKYFNITDNLIAEKKITKTFEGNNLEIENSELSESSTDESEDDSCDDEISSNVDENILTIPDWFAEGIRNNSIPQPYINLYTHHLHFCSPQAEDYNEADSFLCTLPILRYAFDLLTDFSEENCTYISRENDNNYKRITVGPEQSISRPLDVAFKDLSVDDKKLCFSHFLKTKLPDLDLSLIEMLPANVQLYMISLLWWVANCSVTLSNLHSLFLCYLMLEVIDEKTGSFRGHYQFNKQYTKRIAELKAKGTIVDNVDLQTLFLNKNKVHYEDCLIAADVFLKYFDLDDTIRKKPNSYDCKKIHAIAQFQCCLQQFNSLNVLCACPFEGTMYSKLNGTFIYNASLKFEGKDDPYSYLLKQLYGTNSLMKFYKSLCLIYDQCSEKMSLSTVKWTGKKRRRRKNKVDDSELMFIMKGFESEVVI